MRSHVEVHSSNLQPLRIKIMVLNVTIIWSHLGYMQDLVSE